MACWWARRRPSCRRRPTLVRRPSAARGLCAAGALALCAGDAPLRRCQRCAGGLDQCPDRHGPHRCADARHPPPGPARSLHGRAHRGGGAHLARAAAARGAAEGRHGGKALGRAARRVRGAGRRARDPRGWAACWARGPGPAMPCSCCRRCCHALRAGCLYRPASAPRHALLPPPPPAPCAGDAKKRYWRLSLLIHPDKCDHPGANDAFQAVSLAAKELQDAGQRGKLDDRRKEAGLRAEFAKEMAKQERERQWRVARGEATAEDLAGPAAPAELGRCARTRLHGPGPAASSGAQRARRLLARRSRAARTRPAALAPLATPPGQGHVDDRPAARARGWQPAGDAHGGCGGQGDTLTGWKGLGGGVAGRAAGAPAWPGTLAHWVGPALCPARRATCAASASAASRAGATPAAGR